MDFENFCNNNENIKKAKTIEKQTGINYDEMMNKYKNKSTNELYEELIKVANTQKANGNLNKAQLDNIYNTLAPMMNEKERENLKNLLKIIG